MARILIVDDSTMARRLLRRILESGGHEVLEEPDGLAGLERFSLERPDLVFLDLSMPGLSGLDVLEAMRRINPDVRVLIATADVQKLTQEIALAGGAAGYIIKPFVADQVLHMVDVALKGARAL